MNSIPQIFQTLLNIFTVRNTFKTIKNKYAILYTELEDILNSLQNTRLEHLDDNQIYTQEQENLIYEGKEFLVKYQELTENLPRSENALWGLISKKQSQLCKEMEGQLLQYNPIGNSLKELLDSHINLQSTVLFPLSRQNQIQRTVSITLTLRSSKNIEQIFDKNKVFLTKQYQTVRAIRHANRITVFVFGRKDFSKLYQADSTLLPLFQQINADRHCCLVVKPSISTVQLLLVVNRPNGMQVKRGQQYLEVDQEIVLCQSDLLIFLKQDDKEFFSYEVTDFH